MVARPDHPGIGATLDLAALGRLQYVALINEFRRNSQIDRGLLVHGIKRRIVLSVGQLWSMPPVVEESDLVAMLPRNFANYLARRFALAIHELPVRLPEQHLYMMWHTKMEGDPGHRWLRDMLKAIARERLGTGDRSPDERSDIRAD